MADESFTKALETDDRKQALNARLLLLASKARHEDVLKLVETYPAADVDAEVFVALQVAFIMDGRYEDARRVGEAGNKVADHPMIAYNLACTHALMGDADQALSWLKIAMEGGYNDVEHILKDDDLASIRDTEEFRDMLKTAAEQEA